MKTLYLFVILILHKYFLTTDAYLNYHSRMDRDDQFGYESDDTFEDAPAHEEKRSTDNEPIDEYEANDVAKRNSLYGDISKLTDLKSLSDEDISLALSKLSSNELETLDKFIEAESDRADNELRKREVDNNKKDEDDDDYDEISNESNEKPNEKKRCDQNDYGKEIRYNAHDFDDEDEAVKKIDKRKISVPLRRGRIQRLTPEQRIEAKLNFLRDKYKRQSQLKKLEYSIQNRQEKREADNAIEMPYYNVLLGPRIRAKRANNELDDSETQNSDHIRQLEESFPNPNSHVDDENELHIRVKRNYTIT